MVESKYTLSPSKWFGLKFIGFFLYSVLILRNQKQAVKGILLQCAPGFRIGLDKGTFLIQKQRFVYLFFHTNLLKCKSKIPPCYVHKVRNIREHNFTRGPRPTCPPKFIVLSTCLVLVGENRFLPLNLQLIKLYIYIYIFSKNLGLFLPKSRLGASPSSSL